MSNLVKVSNARVVGMNSYMIEVEGFDAIRVQKFKGIVTYKEGFIGGELCDPKRSVLSRSCISIIRKVINDCFNL